MSLHINPKLNIQRPAFTLLELIVVMVIIAMLAIISLPQFSAMKENSFDQEAITSLKIIQDAEKYHKMKTSSYVSCSNAVAINSWLGLSLITAETPAPTWNYKVEATAGAFTAKAQRNGSDSRIKCIQETNDEPYPCYPPY